MMPNIVEFILARLQEDEDAATAAAQWIASGPHPNVSWYGRTGDSTAQRFGAAAAHIARHDPARVLREVAAKRELISRTWDGKCTGHPGPWIHHDDYGPGYCMEPDECSTFHVLAMSYVDHPDYRAEWATPLGPFDDWMQ
ncbi:hypothetical protein G4X40_20245 [Rhodococcus sp. D2-41]|uniref:DUF6221 family protein n=1 Tax=Speluncibacter jeojiensis TaxID=2710754 RepID=UPI00240F3BE5|nr:DUF6221 family protein [Rhodococcus sp. D2-41]MDG3012474.1 hypothetical protein [Rhodococcus sp. D2-41]